MKKKSDKAFNLRIPNDLYKSFQEKCEKDGVSVATALKQFMIGEQTESDDLTVSSVIPQPKSIEFGIAGGGFSRASDEPVTPDPATSPYIKQAFGRDPIDGDFFYNCGTLHSCTFRDGKWYPLKNIGKIWTMITLKKDLSGSVQTTEDISNVIAAAKSSGYHVLLNKERQIAIATEYKQTSEITFIG